MHLVVFLFSILSLASAGMGPVEETTGEPVVEPFIQGGVSTTGLFWDYFLDALFYIEPDFNHIHRYDTSTDEDEFITLDATPSFIIPTREFNRRFVINVGNRIQYLFWAFDFAEDYFAECMIVTADYDCPRNIFNDGRADAYGRIWSITNPVPDLEGNVPPNQGSLYRIDIRKPGKADIDVAIKGITNGNDLIWTKDNRIFYFSDSETACIYAYDYNLVKGVISNGRRAFCFSDFDIPGRPEGIAIDWNDDLWIAVNTSGLVLNVNPNTGVLMRSFTVPVDYVSDVEFGGPDMDILYVSTVDTGNPLETEAGTIFQVTGLNVYGVFENYAVMNSDCTPEFLS